MEEEILKLKNQKITTYKEDNELYLKIEGETDICGQKCLLTIPKISASEILNVGISWDREYANSPYYNVKLITCDISKGDIRFKLYPVNGSYYTYESIEKEMSKEEIEKELGYKIKIKGE